MRKTFTQKGRGKIREKENRREGRKEGGKGGKKKKEQRTEEGGRKKEGKWRKQILQGGENFVKFPIISTEGILS